MKNMKITLKLITSFLIVIALSIVVAMVGIFSMSMLNSADDDMYNTNLLAIDAMGRISQNISEQNSYVRDIVIYETDQAAYGNAEKMLTELDKEFTALCANYQATITNDTDQGNFDSLKSLYSSGFATMKRDVISTGAVNNFEGARAALDEGASVAAQIDALLEQSLAYNAEESKTVVDNNTNSFIRSTIIEIVILVFAISTSVALALYISRLIGRPITKMVNAANSIAVGNMNVDVAYDSKDEVGIMAIAFGKMIDGIKTQVDVVQELAGGNLTVDVTPRSSEDSMGIALERMVDSLNSMFDTINTSSDQVNSGAEQVSSASQNLSQGATEQASAIEELSASINQINAQIKQNAEESNKANDISEETMREVEVSNKSMQDMLGAMTNINTSSNEISKIIKVIEDIAFQTNILALNAAVEAARAGEAGKGFAVVADEVRSLASKSADAAKQTTALIEGSVKSVSDGVVIAQNTAESLRQVASKTKDVSEMIKHIADSSAEQAQGIMQINQGVEQISMVVQTNSATAEESAAASEELSGQSNMLKQEISKFRLKSTSSRQAVSTVSKPKSRPVERNQQTYSKPAAMKINLDDKY